MMTEDNNFERKAKHLLQSILDPSKTQKIKERDHTGRERKYRKSFLITELVPQAII